MKNKIKKLIILLISMVLTVAVTATVFADADTIRDSEGNIVYGNNDETDKLKIYSQTDYNADPELVATLSLDDLIDISDSGRIGYMYMKDGWSAWGVTDYVTIESLLINYGLSFSPESVLKIRSEATDFDYTLTHDNYTSAVYTFENATGDRQGDNSPTIYPACIGIAWDGGEPVGEGITVRERIDALCDTAYYSGTLRFFMGVRTEDFAVAQATGNGGGSALTVAGNRSVNEVDTLILIEDAEYDHKVVFNQSEGKRYRELYLKDGDLIIAPENLPHYNYDGNPEDYVFCGWYYFAAGDTEHADPILYSADDIATEDRTYYPIWELKEEALIHCEATEATCVTAGNTEYWVNIFADRYYSSYDCQELIEKDSWIIPATGEHSWDEGQITKEATTSEEGIRTYTCSVCGEKKTEQIPKLPEEETATGWQKDEDGIWHYYENNALVTGWKKVNGIWYLFNNDGDMLTGWQKVGSTWYYMKDSGAMATGWVQVGNDWYYMKESGAMATGWVQVGNDWYYMKSSGAMATGWIKVGNDWYYMKGSGAMTTGWIKVGNDWYYMKGSGAMTTGWLQLGSTWYYFWSSGAMATGRVNINGRINIFASSGAWQGYGS